MRQYKHACSTCEDDILQQNGDCSAQHPRNLKLRCNALARLWAAPAPPSPTWCAWWEPAKSSARSCSITLKGLWQATLRSRRRLRLRCLPEEPQCHEAFDSSSSFNVLLHVQQLTLPQCVQRACHVYCVRQHKMK